MDLTPPPPAYDSPWAHGQGSKQHPFMTDDSLANAIVASSLASSRAPSPAKPDGPPAVPLPRRHGKTHLFGGGSSSGGAGHDPTISRTPSPSKSQGLARHTMRDATKSPAPAADDGPGARHRAKRGLIIKKHPHKHHEGERKRWRDSVTERERKRYEGVWAANRGGFGAPPALVSNMAVRDVWARSRLPADVLADVWALVDRQHAAALDREEFVVGLWLIDQRLKGRKLPPRVSASVWDSVRGLGGVTVHPFK